MQKNLKSFKNIVNNALAKVKLYRHRKHKCHQNLLSCSKSRQYMMNSSKKNDKKSQRPQNLHFSKKNQKFLIIDIGVLNY